MLISGVDRRRVGGQNRNDGTQVAVSGGGVKLIFSAGAGGAAPSLRPSHFDFSASSLGSLHLSSEKEKTHWTFSTKIVWAFRNGP